MVHNRFSLRVNNRYVIENAIVGKNIISNLPCVGLVESGIRGASEGHSLFNTSYTNSCNRSSSYNSTSIHKGVNFSLQ